METKGPAPQETPNPPAVGDGPAVVTGGKGPGTLADVAVVLGQRLLRLLHHLARVHVGAGPAQRPSGKPCHPRGRDGLHGKGRVPQLAAVVALHLHPVLGHPQVVVQAGQVQLEGLGVGVFKPAAQHVEHLVHGTDVHIPRVFVLAGPGRGWRGVVSGFRRGAHTAAGLSVGATGGEGRMEPGPSPRPSNQTPAWCHTS